MGDDQAFHSKNFTKGKKSIGEIHPDYVQITTSIVEELINKLESIGVTDYHLHNFSLCKYAVTEHLDEKMVITILTHLKIIHPIIDVLEVFDHFW